MLEFAAEVIVIAAIELGFQVGFQHPFLTDTVGVVVDKGGAPAIGTGGHVRVLAVVLTYRHSDQAQQAAVSARHRVVDEKQRAAHLWIAQAALAAALVGAGKACADVGKGQDELRRAQRAAGVGEIHLTVGHGVDPEVGLAGAVGGAMEIAGTGGGQVQHTQAGARWGGEKIAGVEVGSLAVEAEQAGAQHCQVT